MGVTIFDAESLCGLSQFIFNLLNCGDRKPIPVRDPSFQERGITKPRLASNSHSSFSIQSLVFIRPRALVDDPLLVSHAIQLFDERLKIGLWKNETRVQSQVKPMKQVETHLGGSFRNFKFLP